MALCKRNSSAGQMIAGSWSSSRFAFSRTIGPIICVSVAVFLSGSEPALAHGAEQGFILLLPTEIYIATAMLAAAITAIGLAFMPAPLGESIFRSWRAGSFRRSDGSLYTSWVAAAVFLVLAILGFVGPSDPYSNLLPLFIWSLWWICLPVFQAVIGDLWHWLNPWRGPICGLRAVFGKPMLKLRPGQTPAIVLLLGFAAFMLAHPSPEDPEVLAMAMLLYAAFNLVGMTLFGEGRWLGRVECFTAVFRCFAQLSPLQFRKGTIRIGLPGWKIIRTGHVPVTASIFALAILGIGSFDGLNETFWWLTIIGVNPVEFPGRTEVISETLLGIAAFNILLFLVVAGTIKLGVGFAGRGDLFKSALVRLLPCFLPIALGYHFAHFLPSLLVNAQYALKATTDPFHSGADLLGLGRFYVTTGFFKTTDTVRVIWLTQAAAVLGGHLHSFLLSHAVGLHLFGNRRQAALAVGPLTCFMVLYTLFGLWLLAAPKGL